MLDCDCCASCCVLWTFAASLVSNHQSSIVPEAKILLMFSTRFLIMSHNVATFQSRLGRSNNNGVTSCRKSVSYRHCFNKHALITMLWKTTTLPTICTKYYVTFHLGIKYLFHSETWKPIYNFHVMCFMQIFGWYYVKTTTKIRNFISLQMTKHTNSAGDQTIAFPTFFYWLKNVS